MKRAWLGLAIGAFAIDVGWHGVNALLRAHDRSAFRRNLADAVSVARALDAYRSSNSTYPATMTLEGLRSALVPEYIRFLPSGDLQYFSDGATYTFILWPWRSAPYRSIEAGPGPLGVRDGVLVAWPEWLKLKEPWRMVASDQAAQPNYAVNPPHSVVTALAQASKRRAAGRAGYRER